MLCDQGIFSSDEYREYVDAPNGGGEGGVEASRAKVVLSAVSSFCSPCIEAAEIVSGNALLVMYLVLQLFRNSGESSFDYLGLTASAAGAAVVSVDVRCAESEVDQSFSKMSDVDYFGHFDERASALQGLEEENNIPSGGGAGGYICEVEDIEVEAAPLVLDNEMVEVDLQNARDSCVTEADGGNSGNELEAGGGAESTSPDSAGGAAGSDGEVDASPLDVAAAVEAEAAEVVQAGAESAEEAVSSNASESILHRDDVTVETIRAALALSPDLVNRPDQSGQTPLIYYCSKRKWKQAAVVMESGADVNAVDSVRTNACPRLKGEGLM